MKKTLCVCSVVYIKHLIMVTKIVKHVGKGYHTGMEVTNSLVREFKNGSK